MCFRLLLVAIERKALSRGLSRKREAERDGGSWGGLEEEQGSRHVRTCAVDPFPLDYPALPGVDFIFVAQLRVRASCFDVPPRLRSSGLCSISQGKLPGYLLEGVAILCIVVQ